MPNREKSQWLAWIIKTGLWIIPLLPIYVSDSMLFPFITGKNFAFRIIVQIIFALWVALMIADERYRLRLTPLIKAATIFVTVVFLADIFGPNPYRSLFSNYERMEGFMMIFHLYLYFLMLGAMFRSRRDWVVFFHSTLVASLLVSYVALLQKLGLRTSIQGGFRVDSTIGNPTYLAAYLVFHVWLLGILLKQFWNNLWLRIPYLVALIFELAIIYFSATRGAIIALVVTSILLFSSIVIFWKKFFRASGAGRVWSSVLLAAVIVIPAIFWMMRNADFIQKNPALSRLTNYSFEERTIQSRFKIWQMAFAGAKERPLLGWGQENFYLVFQKYYNPGLWSSEPWFDRSHNLIFDWLVHTGFIGLLSFLSLLGVAAWLVLKKSLREGAHIWEGVLLLCLLISYFIQNLFVFDNLNTYLLLFAFLAYIGYVFSPKENLPDSRGNKNPVAYAVPFLLVVVVVGYFLDIKPIREARALIRTLRLYQTARSMDELLDSYKKTLSYHTFGDTEVREQMGNINRSIIQDPRFSAEEKKKFTELAISEVRKQLENPARDLKHILFLGSLLEIGAGTYNQAYAPEAEKVLQEALKISPKKQLVYFELAQLYISANLYDKALPLLYTAWQLDKNYQQAAADVWMMAVLNKRDDIVAEVLQYSSLDKLAGENLLYTVAIAYQKVGNFEKAAEFYDRMVKTNPNVAQFRATYAAILAKIGRDDEARVQVEAAIKLDPSFKTEGEQFLKTLKPAR